MSILELEILVGLLSQAVFRAFASGNKILHDPDRANASYFVRTFTLRLAMELPQIGAATVLLKLGKHCQLAGKGTFNHCLQGSGHMVIVDGNTFRGTVIINHKSPLGMYFDLAMTATGDETEC